jgi:hypothetical protein
MAFTQNTTGEAMSDIDHGRADKDTSNTTYLSSLNNELMAALHEAKSKQQKPAPNLNQPTRTESSQLTKLAFAQQAKTGPNSLASAEHAGREPVSSARSSMPQPQLQPQLQPQAKLPENLPRLKGADSSHIEDTSRTLVSSAASVLRTGIPVIQRIVESRSRNDDGAKDLNVLRKDLIAEGQAGNAARPSPDVDAAQQALKLTKSSTQESEKLTVVSYKFDAAPTTPEIKNQSGDLKNTANGLKDALITYGEVSLPTMQLATQRAAQPTKELVLSVPTVLESAKTGSAPVRISEQMPNSNLTTSKVVTNVSETVARPATAPVLGTAEGLRTPEGAAMQLRDYSKSPVNAVTVTGITEAAKPGINVSINVKSFSADGQVKSLLPSQLPPAHSMPVPLRSPIPYGTPVPGVFGRTDGEPETLDINSELKSMNLKAGDKRYALGAEIALVALTAAAGASRRRMESTGKQQGQHQHLDEEGEESAVSEATF